MHKFNPVNDAGRGVGMGIGGSYAFLVVSSALRRPLLPPTGGSQAAANTLLSSRVQSPSCLT